jgi:hypothetical protein
LIKFGKYLASAQIMPSATLQQSWNGLCRWTYVLDAWQQTWATEVQDGWRGEASLLRLLRKAAQPINVNDVFPSLKMPGCVEYVKPATILETRALIHSLCWILYTLGYNHDLNQPQGDNVSTQHLKHALGIFLNSFYRRETGGVGQLVEKHLSIIDAAS